MYLEFRNKIKTRGINLGFISLHMKFIAVRLDEMNYRVRIGRANLEA